MKKYLKISIVGISFPKDIWYSSWTSSLAAIEGVVKNYENRYIPLMPPLGWYTKKILDIAKPSSYSNAYLLSDYFFYARKREGKWRWMMDCWSSTSSSKSRVYLLIMSTVTVVRPSVCRSSFVLRSLFFSFLWRYLYLCTYIGGHTSNKHDFCHACLWYIGHTIESNKSNLAKQVWESHSRYGEVILIPSVLSILSLFEFRVDTILQNHRLNDKYEKCSEIIVFIDDPSFNINSSY